MEAAIRSHQNDKSEHPTNKEIIYVRRNFTCRGGRVRAVVRAIHEPAKDYSADVVKDIAEKAWDVIQRSADIDVDDYVEEQKDRAADEKGEELPRNRKRERRESEWRK